MYDQVLKIMTDNLMPDIRLEGGKYTVRQTQAGLEALRYDESWRDLTGDNLVYAMVVEILALRERLTPSDVKEFPDVSGWWWCRAKGDNFLPGDELCVEVIADNSVRSSVMYGREVYHVCKIPMGRDPDDRLSHFDNMLWCRQAMSPFSREVIDE